MKKTLAIVAAGAFAASVSSPAFACMYNKMVSTEKPAEITTALNSKPTAPEIQPIAPKPADRKAEVKSES